MFKHAEIKNLDDFFAGLSQRSPETVYFYRITEYGEELGPFLQRVYRAALPCGIIIDGGLPNPDPSNLAYYNEIMGMRFELDKRFLSSALSRWLPRVDQRRLGALAEAMFETLSEMRRAGKNDNVLRNVYIKFMCWLYYKFERMLGQLGGEQLPKILLDGSISAHGLLMLSLLSLAGCDVILLLTGGENAYRSADPQLRCSFRLPLKSPGPFPQDFGLGKIREGLRQEEARGRIYEPLPKRSNSTNTWLSGDILSDLSLPPEKRGRDQAFFYNAFCSIRGAEDKLSYQKDLYKFQLDLKKAKRNLVIINGRIERPSYDEINAIRRSNANSIDRLAADLVGNISFPGNQEIYRLMRKAFLDLLFEEAKKETQMNRVSNRAVSLLCLIKRYQEALFAGLQDPALACFIYFGPCSSETDALFCRFLARMPVDVLVLNPDLEQSGCLSDPLLHAVQYENSLRLEKFPEDESGLRLGTTAYNAERDLDNLIYGDTGLFRNQQFHKAKTIVLQTMYEEISLLWDQEMKYRPNFDIVDDTVHLPVILAKVSGVKDGAVSAYWNSIRALLTPETILIREVPRIREDGNNPIKSAAYSFLRGGKLQREEILRHSAYPYGILREPVQHYLLDKLQLLIDSRIVKGTFENGAEYRIITTALSLEKDLVRMIQKFDFTKKNPKLIYLVTGEAPLSQEDAICTAFLSLMGFDILLFVPTGYQCIEQYFTRKLVEEHQIGEYLYDLPVPNLSSTASKKRKSLSDFFRRGNS